MEAEEQPLGTPQTTRAEDDAGATPVQNETEHAATCGSLVLNKVEPTVTFGISDKLHQAGAALVVPPKLLTAAGVQSASLAHVTVWAMTRDLVREILAAACRKTVEGGPTRAEKGEALWASSTEARLVACALLSRVFEVGAGDGVKVFGTSASNSSGVFETGMDDNIGLALGTKGNSETSLLLDRWYEDFWGVTSRFDEGKGSRLGDASRLLLEGMLVIPNVRTGFVQRGLVRRLTAILRSSYRRYHGYPALSPRVNSSCGSAKLNQRANVKHCLNKSRPRNEVGQCSSRNDGDHCDPRNHGDQCVDDSDRSFSQGARFPSTPWWLLKLGRRVEPKSNTHGGSSARGGGPAKAELDESSKTASEEGFTSMEETEHISAAIQECDRTEGGRDKGDSHVFAASAPTSPAGGLLPERGRGGEGRGGVGGEGSRGGGGGRGEREGGEGVGRTPSRERISPPMLRLDVLDSILSSKELVSPRVCSPHADVTLSAASTRASAHLVSFSLERRIKVAGAQLFLLRIPIFRSSYTRHPKTVFEEMCMLNPMKNPTLNHRLRLGGECTRYSVGA